jgi:hypothetical protein
MLYIPDPVTTAMRFHYRTGWVTCNREVSHQYEYDTDNEYYIYVINSFSNNKMVLHLQAENATNIPEITNVLLKWAMFAWNTPGSTETHIFR